MKKYLLERFPLVWNTHLIWALPLILATHLFFFLWGFATITDENMSNYSFGLENHFEGLPMVMSFIIIVLMLVGWFIRLFKNNAFKRFYPVSEWQLFRQFVIYLFIMGGILSSGLSFTIGESAKVHLRYTDSYIHNVLQQYPKNFNFEDVERLPEAQQREYNIANNAKDIKKRLFVMELNEEITMVETAVFILTSLLFIVRITSLRTALLTILFSGLLCLLFALLVVFILFMDIENYGEDSILFFLLWIIYLSILLYSTTSSNKLQRGIAMNITILAFFPIIIATLFFLEKRYFRRSYDNDIHYSLWHNFEELIIFSCSILLSIGFIGLYTNVIKRWRAMPE